MDKVLDNEQDKATETNDGVNTNEFDLSLNDILDDEQSETLESSDEPDDDGESSDEEDSDEEDASFDLGGSQSNTAFAAMRTENKKYKDSLSQVENLAKQLGFNDVDSFVKSANSRLSEKASQQSGLSPELYKTIQDLSKSVEDIKGALNQQETNAKMQNFANDLQTFVTNNKLTDADVTKLSKDLSKDGITEQVLLSMPKNALYKLLGSYTKKPNQENLTKKEQIMKEMPVSQSSNKVDVNKLNNDIDKLAKMLAGK